MSRTHRYTGEAVIVEFDLGRCIHTGDCTRDLPGVFDTRRSGRWVHADGATVEQVARVCADCPTGALRCIDKVSGELMHARPRQNTIQLIADGPLYVHADMQINDEDEPTGHTALCRCGASHLMPRCDNSHRESGFCDTGQVNLPLPSQAADQGRLSISSIPDGPLMIEGPFTLLDGEGGVVCKSDKAALCRCGASKMKPYCDGSHNQIGFRAA